MVPWKYKHFMIGGNPRIQPNLPKGGLDSCRVSNDVPGSRRPFCMFWSDYIQWVRGLIRQGCPGFDPCSKAYCVLVQELNHPSNVQMRAVETKSGCIDYVELPLALALRSGGTCDTDLDRNRPKIKKRAY